MSRISAKDLLGAVGHAETAPGDEALSLVPGIGQNGGRMFEPGTGTASITELTSGSQGCEVSNEGEDYPAR